MKVKLKETDLNRNITDHCSDVEYNTLLNYQLEMFQFNNFPKTFEPYFFLKYAIENGTSCIAKMPKRGGDGEEYVSATAQLCGMPNANGIGTDCIVTTRDGRSYQYNEWFNNGDIVVFNINRTFQPDLNLKAYSSMWHDTRITINSILKMARLNKIITTSDSSIRSQVEDAIDNIESGKLTTILSDKTSPFASAPTEPFRIMDISDVSNNGIIQYLSHFEDDIIRKYMTMYGINIQATSKMAQQSVEEVNNGENYSLIVANMRKSLLDDFCMRCNELFNFGCSVEYSPLWKKVSRETLKEDSESEESENDEI